MYTCTKYQPIWRYWIKKNTFLVIWYGMIHYKMNNIQTKVSYMVKILKFYIIMTRNFYHLQKILLSLVLKMHDLFFNHIWYLWRLEIQKQPLIIKLEQWNKYSCSILWIKTSLVKHKLKTTEDTRRVLGMVGHSRRYIQGFNKTAHPSYQLLKRGTTWTLYQKHWSHRMINFSRHGIHSF